jgi:hypothetical protein
LRTTPNPFTGASNCSQMATAKVLRATVPTLHERDIKIEVLMVQMIDHVVP